MPPILSMSMWTSLSNEMRNRIRREFSIPRSKSVEVHDGNIITDGTTPEDFKSLTIEKMQVYLKTDSTDFHKLFDMVVAKITDEMINEKGIIVTGTGIIPIENVTSTQVIVTDDPVTIISEPKKRGRPSKK